MNVGFRMPSKVETEPAGRTFDVRQYLNFVWRHSPRELAETSLRQLSTHKRVAGIVLNSVNQNRAKKYGGEYYYRKSYENLLPLASGRVERVRGGVVGCLPTRLQ